MKKLAAVQKCLKNNLERRAGQKHLRFSQIELKYCLDILL